MTNTNLDPTGFGNILLLLEQEINSIPMGRRAGGGGRGGFNSHQFNMITPRCLQVKDHRRAPKSFIMIDKDVNSYLTSISSER